MPEQAASTDYDRQVREHLSREAERVRPFCGEWPFASSDLDLVLPEQNNAVHRARGCCDGPTANGDGTCGRTPGLTPGGSPRSHARTCSNANGETCSCGHGLPEHRDERDEWSSCACGCLGYHPPPTRPNGDGQAVRDA